jgi:2-oxoisovalerate dehydrogenase E2 component (dihydrolipoyl transacylase)
MFEFKLPDPGEGLTEAEIVRWVVAAGDEVAVNDVLVEIETAKSLVELPSPYAGVVAELLVAEGEMVAVGSPIIRIGERGETWIPAAEPTEPTLGSAEPALAEPAIADQPAEPTAVLVGYGVRTASTTRRRRAVPPHSSNAPSSNAQSATVQAPIQPLATQSTAFDELGAVPRPITPTPLPRSTPAVRRVARDLGVDLTQLNGTGPDGLITAEDVVAAHTQPRARDERIPLRGIRRQMFNSMTASLQIPQATALIEADVTGTVDMLQTLKQRREFAELRVSPLLVFAKAACLAISRIPEINSSFDGSCDEIVLHKAVNLGIAAATPRGLLVPNIKNADRMNLTELAQALTAMVAVARDGRVQPADLARGTFTITNIGVFGVDGGTPILSPGESAIMCLGTIRRKPWVVGTGADEHLEPRSVCTVSLTFDHRLVDGAMASKFLAEVATIMSNPGLALMF